MAEFITKSTLRERGWTDSLIKQFLGAPDRTKMNPRYRKAAPMQLFDLNRVAGVEAMEEFLRAKTKSATRSASATAIAKRKKTETLEAIATIPNPELPALGRSALTRLACNHYNDFRLGQDFDLATTRSDADFLARITVNYIRHSLTDYEHRLSALFGKTGRHDAYILVRQKILGAIGKAYPWLANECERQSNREETDL